MKHQKRHEKKRMRQKMKREKEYVVVMKLPKCKVTECSNSSSE